MKILSKLWIIPLRNKNPQRNIQIEQNRKTQAEDDQRTRIKFFEWVDWTHMFLEKTEKQAFQGILVDYDDIFVGHKMVNGVNTESKVDLTLKFA